MAFITNGVGRGGKNNAEDVKIVQWLLQTAQYYYGSKIFSRGYGIPENGILDNDTTRAIQDVINYPKLLNNSRFNNSLANSVKCIFPNDESYRFLIRCSIKPLCVPCEENRIQFEDNSVARQAIQDRINFITFRHIAEAIEKENICRTLTARGATARNHLKSPQIRAFLDMLAVVEGTDANNDGRQEGFNVQMGGTPDNQKTVMDLSRHSGNVALGRYQAIPSTWREAAAALGLRDFTPESQDIFAVGKLMDRDMINDILNDRFEDAIDKGSKEWASLPNRDKTAKNGGKKTSFYDYTSGKDKGKPQSTPFSVEELKQKWEAALKIYDPKRNK